MIWPDKIFSYWVFFWYFLYIFKIITISPKLALIIGLIENILLLFFIFTKTSMKLILYFCITVIITKIIPLITLWNTTIHRNDWKYLLGLFMIYVAWIYVTGYITVYFKIAWSLTKNDTSQLPGVMFIKTILDKNVFLNEN